MKFDYSWGKTRNDLLAGVTVAAISLPQAMAYAMIAGVDPRFGLYSAIVVTLVASIFGSSSHLINGPTNAISLVVFSALGFFNPDARLEAYQAMFLLGIMIGCIQILIAIGERPAEQHLQSRNRRHFRDGFSMRDVGQRWFVIRAFYGNELEGIAQNKSRGQFIGAHRTVHHAQQIGKVTILNFERRVAGSPFICQFGADWKIAGPVEIGQPI